MKIFYIHGTHWDREWYEPFQEYRRWLVDLIDGAMKLLEEHPEFACFHLDGQSSVLDDYLHIRPEERDRLVKLLKERRLLAGPWYIQPDHWLVSGESHIRNLMKGIRTCTEMGFEPMRFFYAPDQFGHPAHMPMLAAGFGYDACVVWRGTQNQTFDNFFVWTGPDGSKMVTAKLPDGMSYVGFRGKAYERLEDDEGGLTEENLRRLWDPFLEYPIERDTAPLRIVMDAFDHQPPAPNMPHVLALAKKAYPEHEVTWAALEEVGDALRTVAAQLPERSGEIRSAAIVRGPQYLIAHCQSARYPLKQRNDQCAALLERWAEPVGLFEAMAGGEAVDGALARAWEYLIRNHPHDSICGCSIDQVHKDMHFRFDQCELLADGIINRYFVEAGNATADAEYTFALHNPLPFARKEVVELTLPFTGKWSRRWTEGLMRGEVLNRFRLIDAAGNALPYQIQRVDRGKRFKRLDANNRRRQFLTGDLYRLAVEVDLPPCGYTGFRAEPCDEVTRTWGTLRTGPLAARNQYFAFTLDPSGTATLATKAGNYESLFLYEDSADAGDGWTWGPVTGDIVYRSPGARVMTAVEEDGPLRTVFRVEREFILPGALDHGQCQRSQDRTAMRVTDRIYVEKGAPCLRVRTTIENAVKDHRFRVLFPTGLEKAASSFAETPFALVERSITAPEGSQYWEEKVNAEAPFTSFFGVQDGKRGLALLSAGGLHEYEVTATPERALAPTLFRAFQHTVGTSGEPGGELQETLEFEYLLFPFAGAFDPVAAGRFAAAAQTGVRMHNTAEVCTPHSFLTFEKGSALVTAIKEAAGGDAGIVRLWNPTDRPVTEVIHAGVHVSRAERCNLNEESQGGLPLREDGGIEVDVQPGGLATVRFFWEGEANKRRELPPTGAVLYPESL